MLKIRKNDMFWPEIGYYDFAAEFSRKCVPFSDRSAIMEPQCKQIRAPPLLVWPKETNKMAKSSRRDFGCDRNYFISNFCIEFGSNFAEYFCRKLSFECDYHLILSR